MNDDSNDEGKAIKKEEKNGDKTAAVAGDKKEEEKQTTEDNEGVKILMEVLGKDQHQVPKEETATADKKQNAETSKE